MRTRMTSSPRVRREVYAPEQDRSSPKENGRRIYTMGRPFRSTRRIELLRTLLFLLRSRGLLLRRGGLLGSLLFFGGLGLHGLGGLFLDLLGFGLRLLLGEVHLRLLSLLLFRSRDGFRSRALHELHQRHRGVVTGTRLHVQDAGVATRTRLEARTDGLEELGDDLAVAQARERKTAVGFAVFLAERDERL